MLRRNFFRWISTTVIPFFFPRWAHNQTVEWNDSETYLLLELAAVALPSSLGKARIAEIGTRFARWIQNYKAGADAGYAYGSPHVDVLPANPAVHYADQLRELETAAHSRGTSFARLDPNAKREIVAAAIEQAHIERIPSRPNGAHVAADLLAFFYNSAGGQDFLYDAAIRRDDCRGLANSAHRPQRFS